MKDDSMDDVKLDFRIRLVREKPFYGPGVHQLLLLTDETGSLREACRRMGLSYSKGRSILSRAEQQFGSPVIESRQGGRVGGSSVLTEKGRKLVRNYARFCDDAAQRLRELFSTHFDS